MQQITVGQTLKIGLCPLFIFILSLTACFTSIHSQVNQTGQEKLMNHRDINAVLKDHDKKLLAIPGVVGVYVGLLPDDETLCLKVMVIKETEEIKERIPKSIEGYPVLIEESGPIRPLKDDVSSHG